MRQRRYAAVVCVTAVRQIGSLTSTYVAMLLTVVGVLRLQNQSSIVFVPTRKHARLTAMDILGYASADGLPKRFLAVCCLTSV
jgi:hypothetical protein